MTARVGSGTPDVVVEAQSAPSSDPERPTCDVCGSMDLRDIRCKVICGNCKTILRSCADL